MKVITTEEQLQEHLPNVIASVRGETPLITKMTVFLNMAELWVEETFTSAEGLDEICAIEGDSRIKQTTARLVVVEAMLRAIPSLDIVMTQNGFAVVSTQNLAPASKPRMDRLIEAMQQHKDSCIAMLLPMLPAVTGWTDSRQAVFFGSTLFPTMSIVDAMGVREAKWDEYLKLRAKLIDMEAGIADEWVSPELMESLRAKAVAEKCSDKEKWVVGRVRALLVAMLMGDTRKVPRLRSIVDFIRENPEDFPLWHESETAKLFMPPVFNNVKKAAGYFF